MFERQGADLHRYLHRKDEDGETQEDEAQRSEDGKAGRDGRDQTGDALNQQTTLA